MLGRETNLIGHVFTNAASDLENCLSVAETSVVWSDSVSVELIDIFLCNVCHHRRRLVSSDHYSDDTTSGLFIHSLICPSDYHLSPPSQTSPLGIRDPKGSWCCWRQLSYFSLFLYGIRVASTGVYFVPKPLCRRKLASALCRKPRILSRTSSEPLCSLLGCSGLGGFSELDPGGSALQILQDAHNSTARKLSQSLLPSI